MSKEPVARVVDNAGTEHASAPELRAFHDQIFEKAENDQGDIYGSPDDWSLIKRTGHFRRMALLDATDLPGIETKVAVDFGTGPWGFACVFPKLRKAARCIGMDVSLKALEIAARRDADMADRTTYNTSDGETIPLDDDSVDIFWGGEVIEHVREPRRFMQEVARVCKDGARVFLSTPNKHAVYYLARGEDYAIGPEHFALMDYMTLKTCVTQFLDPVSIVGYETSLSPELDAAIVSETAANLIQERAYRHPQSASGFLVDGVVRKSLFVRNRRTWQLDERLWSDPFVQGTEACDRMRMFGDIDGGGLPPGGSLELPITGNLLVLLAWAHDWSGFMKIEVEGSEREVDLYSPLAGFRRIEIQLNSAGEHRLRITRVGRKSLRSVSDQVIFYKAIGYTVE
jgi:ubiquinone/menaquinone biosynthesis C-methylase UbiE